VSIFSRSSDYQSPEGSRPWRWILVAVSALLLVLGGWLGITALSAKSSLEQAKESAQQVKEALLKGNSEEAAQRAETALAQAKSAQSTTNSLPWKFAAAVPFLGSPFKAGQQISDVVVGLSSDILKPAAESGIGLSPSKLYQNGRVDVQLLRQQEPVLVKLSADANRLNEQAAAIPPAGFVPPINTARTQLQNQTAEVKSLLNNTALAAQIGPSMMGADGPRTYLMAFQTVSEARGTGGLLGGFGVLRFNNGKPTVDTLAPNTELFGTAAAIDLGPEFQDLYGTSRPFTDFRNSNQSPHFPYAAQIWKSMWERQSGEKVDGVIALDQIALSYILSAVGPVKLADGEIVSADNVVELTGSTSYIRFPDDQVARKKYLQSIATEVVTKMTGQVQSPGKLLEALGRAAGERRISVWSASPAEQKVLEETPLGHVLPDSDAPFAQVIINNFGGNKMDYYLKRDIEYAADGCKGDMRNSTVTVRLSNTAPRDVGSLPEYVAGGMGLPQDLPIKVPRGSMVSSVRVLATKGAELVNLTSNGTRVVPNRENVERGHPSFEIFVVIPPGESGELVFQLSEPIVPGEADVPVQPLIDTPRPKVSVPACG
jgi:Sec-independent protein translocase protein TatA